MGGCEGKLQSHGGERSSKVEENKVERFPYRGLGADQHAPVQKACLLSHQGGQGLVAEAPALEFRLRERTGAGSVNTAWRGLVRHSEPGGSPGKSLDLPKRQETIVSGCVRRGDSEHHLNKLHSRVRATAISTDNRDGHEMLRLLLQPPRSLCASTGH